MKQLEVTGKNIEQAIENGLSQLALTRDDVNIKIKDAGGMFKKAKVILEYEEKSEEKAEIKEQNTDKGSSKQVKTEKISLKENEIQSIKEIKKAKTSQKPKVEFQILTKDCTIIEDDKTIIKNESVSFEDNDKKIEKKSIKKQLKDEKIEIKPAIESQNVEKIDIKTKKSKKEYSTEKNEELESLISDFIGGLCKLADTTFSLEFNYSNEGLSIKMSGSNVGKLIGYRGEGLTSLQHILNNIASKGGFDIFITLDIENYREKRKDSLIILAQKMANKVLKTKKNVSIEPMNSYERLIIHSAVTGIEGVVTESVGDGFNRHIVFKLKKN